MKLNRRMFLATTASAAVLTALAACAKNGSGSSGSTAGVPTAAPEELQDGGTLRFGIGSAPANWNAATVDGNVVGVWLVMKFVSPFVVDWAADGKATPNPDYLTKLEAAEVGGKTVVTVAVNEKATWGNGRKWDSEDIKVFFDHVKDPSYSWATVEGIDKVEKVEIVDKQTAKVTFNSVYPDWSNALAGVTPRELMADAKTFNESMAGATKFNNDYFAGPFKIKSYDESKQVITLERNDKWWGATPKLETVTLHVLDDSALGQAFANKEIDVLDYIFSADVYQQASGRDDAEVRQNTGLQWRHIMFNASSGPLADKAVRQAITRACNREAIAASDLAGLPVDAKKTLLGNRFFLPVQEGYQDNSTSWGYDVEAAKKLLDGAGWVAGSDGVRAKDGKKLELVMTIPSNAPVATNEANLLQKQLNEVGIKGVTYVGQRDGRCFVIFDDKAISIIEKFNQEMQDAVSSEMAAVRKQYEGTPQWMMAPNGKPTNLTEEEWLAVRTPAFKAAFGDWEQVATQRALQESEALPISEELFALEGKELRQAAKDVFKNLYQENGLPIRVPAGDGRIITIGMRGLKEIRSHAGFDLVLKIVPNLREIVENGCYLFSRDVEKDNKGKADHTKAFHYYATKVAVEGRAYYVRFVVREYNDLALYYDHDLTRVEEIEKDAVSVTEPDLQTGSDRTTSSVNHSITQWWKGVNEITLAGDVDENGEPLPSVPSRAGAAEGDLWGVLKGERQEDYYALCGGESLDDAA